MSKKASPFQLDVADYQATPPKLVGMSKQDAIAYMSARHGFVFGIAEEDGVSHVLPAIVMIRLRVVSGQVVGTELDGARYGTWA